MPIPIHGQITFYMIIKALYHFLTKTFMTDDEEAIFMSYKFNTRKIVFIILFILSVLFNIITISTIRKLVIFINKVESHCKCDFSDLIDNDLYLKESFKSKIEMIGEDNAP